MAWLAVAVVALAAAAFVGGRQAAAQCGPNPIVCENALTGTVQSTWDVSGAGDSTIQGFTTQISVNVGETVHFKVDTLAAKFNMDIYRMGYYAGRGARKVATITGINGVDQANCFSQGSTGLVDCGNWLESVSWAVPTTAVSGIYFARIARQDTGGASHVFFVVRNDAANADMLFQTSDTTWQAYNQWGGNSFYVGSPAGRAYKLSYNRPFSTRATSPEDWVFNAEYPMVRWLEANGYNISYTSGVDTDRTGAIELKKHRAFISVGHDEYWSAQQRANVESARAAGVNLAFFSGNEVFWKTRWESSIDGTNTPYRTIVTYKETHAGAKIDPMDPPTWTGTWRDPRFSPPADGGRPENALTGTIFTVNCCPAASTTIKVTGAYASQPFWRNTRVAALSASGSTSLTAGMLNYEWDEDLNNGSRPAGLTRLSATTVSGVSKLQDNGSTYATGSATHSLTLYRHASGALVFGAGTVQWSWGLDSTHDRGSAAADTAVRQATVNLFADMGVQPGSLQSGLVPGTTDTTPPVSAIATPLPGASLTAGVPVSVTGTASDVGGQVSKIEVSTNDGATWTQASGTTSWSFTWTPSAGGPATLRSRATDTGGNRETSSVPVGVTVIVPPPDLTPPGVTLTAPGDTAIVSGVAVSVTADATDNVGVAGVQFVLDGANLGAEDTSSPYGVVWNTTAVQNGPHTLRAVARDASGNSTATAVITVTVSNAPPPALAMDAVVSGDRSTASTTVSSPAFSTTAVNELLVAFVSADDSAAGNKVNSISGGGLTWELVLRTNAKRGTAEIWRAFSVNALSNVTVTATLAQSVASSITVVSFKGTDTTGVNGAGAIGATKSASGIGAPTANLTTTRAGSWVFGVGTDWDSPTGRTIGSGQTMIHQYMPPVGDTYWVQRQTSPTAASGTIVTINDTAPTGDQYNLSICEIRPGQ